ncbi:4Fe-4S ferredoxin [Candidatus Sumerlaeota bacterium]|nr:4Fe-4S ferredoxin [Candidatus Sumerlaeota bacterium]
MTAENIERAQMDADIVCVGFGPATAGFLTTLGRGMMAEDGVTLRFESTVMPGMPPVVLCYERADDIAFGVSGVVTRGRFLRASFPEKDLTGEIPMCAEVTDEKLLYLLDPNDHSHRSPLVQAADAVIRTIKPVLPYADDAFTLPWIPPFMRKHGGFVMSMGQFMQWSGNNVMGSGLAQIWPGSPVSEVIFDEQERSVKGVRLSDQGVGKDGSPDAGYMPGMDIHAALTVLGDGPVGAVGRKLDAKLGLPKGNHRREWATGIKFVIDLPEGCDLKPGTVWHTFGYPEPEIAGFLYVHPNNVASLGILIPSSFRSPTRTGYRYLQHWMRHPAIWKHISGGTMRSWGAKSLQEAGRGGEPYLVGNGFARIGEGSGSTNILLNSGVDEAWQTGVLLAEGVLELMEKKLPFTEENLNEAYVKRRRASILDKEALASQHARDGWVHGFVMGVLGMGMAGMTGGKVYVPGKQKQVWNGIPTVEEYYRGRVPRAEIERLRRECKARGESLHDALMDYAGWEPIPYDGKLLVSHQDALLTGGKVQAAGGYANHVRFAFPEICEKCETQICAEICSGQAITVNPDKGAPLFDREKCVHCGACLWNCTHPLRGTDTETDWTNVEFDAGSGGLHSAEN